MSNTNYVVTGHDADSITLRPMGVPGKVSSVTLRRDSIVSVRRTLGIIKAETSGGAVYAVLEGFRKKQVKLTEAAFAQQ